MADDLKAALLESWDRQCQIVDNLTALITSENAHLKPSEDGWSLPEQLAHIHQVRKGWVGQFSPAHREGLSNVYEQRGNEWFPIDDLEEIKRQLQLSAKAVRAALDEKLGAGEPSGGYDHPVFFLQHMVWHEGWHVGLIMLALRLGGLEPADEWEEANVWGLWRTE